MGEDEQYRSELAPNRDRLASKTPDLSWSGVFVFLAGEAKFAYEEDRSYNGPRNTAADAEGVRRAVTESGAAFFTGHDDQGLFGKRKLSNSKSSRECYYPISPAVLR